MNTAYVTADDVATKPFNHDKNRGRWSSPLDFFFACAGYGFRPDIIFVSSMLFGEVGLVLLIPYILMVVLCILPIIVVQTYLGQFSSTGFISAFRISPLFKGIGYVSLAVNLLVLTFYSIFAAIPLFFFFHSLRPVLPWSCEGSTRWMNHTNIVLPCNLTDVKVNLRHHEFLQLPSQRFFLDQFNIDNQHAPYYRNNILPSLQFSWPLIGCNACVWVVVWFVVTKRTEMTGRIIRYSMMAVVGVMALCAVRLGFLPGAFSKFYYINWHRDFLERLDYHTRLPLLGLGGLGPGWGSILGMASFNKFRTDVTKYSWLVCLGQAGLMLVASLGWQFVRNFWASMSSEYVHYEPHRIQWMQLATVPSALATTEMPHFWTLLFFGMMAAGITNLVIVQLLSVLTSLFDEFEVLRRCRLAVVTLAAVVLCLCSMVFCSNYGLNSLDFMSRYTVFTQILLSFLLLLVVLWMYGPSCLQRDFCAMTDRGFPDWILYVGWLVTPIILLICTLYGLLFTFESTWHTPVLIKVMTILVIYPWLIIPGYCCAKVLLVTGNIRTRLKECLRPTDWYPADPEDRQRYVEAYGSTDVSHQLTARDDV